MGWETALLVAASLGSGIMKAKSANDAAEAQAEAAVEQGNLAARNKSQETVLKAARAQTSFLNSGLTLEGTPMAAIEDTFRVGMEDIDQIRKNANTAARNYMKQGRSTAIGALGDSVMSIASGMSFGGPDMFSTTGFGSNAAKGTGGAGSFGAWGGGKAG